MKFYKNGFKETHVVFIGDDSPDDDDYFEYYDEFIPYRFSSRFPDYAAIKKELRDFIDIPDPLGFNSVDIKDAYEMPGFGLDPGGYGEIYDTLFIGHNIKYIVAIRRLSFYWFTLEIFDDPLSHLFNQLNTVTFDRIALHDILKKHRPIKSFRFRKFK